MCVCDLYLLVLAVCGVGLMRDCPSMRAFKKIKSQVLINSNSHVAWQRFKQRHICFRGCHECSHVFCYLYIKSTSVLTNSGMLCLFLTANGWILGGTFHRWPCCCRGILYTWSFWKHWKASLRTIVQPANVSIYEWGHDTWRTLIVIFCE